MYLAEQSTPLHSGKPDDFALFVNVIYYVLGLNECKCQNPASKIALQHLNLQLLGRMPDLVCSEMLNC